ncbi:MAG: serine/threonine-protein kinase [Planctomycetota bacterium]
MGSESRRASHSSGHAPTQNRAGPYELLSVLGQGASGTVYLARRPGIERMFALKLLGADLDPEGRARVEREAQIASRLDHPGIVRVVDVGQLGVQLYIVMEHVPGPTLRDLLAQGALPPARAAELVARIAEAMDAAHAAGVVHRDLKPANVILDARDDAPKVTDFGLARDTRAAHQLTKPGEVIGTPYYMAPEQIQGGRVDARTDVYALGVMLYELLTSRRPFEAPTVAGVVQAILRDAPTPPRKLDPSIPPALERVCLRALARVPEERFPTTRQLAQALAAPSALEPGPSPRVPAFAAAALGALGAAALVLGTWAWIARANLEAYDAPLAAAASALTEEQRTLAATQSELEATEVRVREARAAAAERAQALRARLADVAPLEAEVFRAATEPTGNLARLVDVLVQDMQGVPGSEAARANLLYDRRRFQESRQLYLEARAAGDCDPELAVAYFRASSRLGDEEAGREALAWALEAHPQSLAAEFARCLNGERSLEELAELRQRADLRFNYFHNLLVYRLARQQRTQDAIVAAREAIAFDPADSDALESYVALQLLVWRQGGITPSVAELAEVLHAHRVHTDLGTGALSGEHAAIRQQLELLLRRVVSGR